VLYAKAQGFPLAATTRSTLGHDGSRQPGDVALNDGSGAFCEVKNVARSAWPTWLSQTREQAQGRPWVLVRKTPRVSDPGEWVAAIAANRIMLTLPEPPMLMRSTVAHPDRWLDVTRFAAWPAQAVLFCSFADALRLLDAR
jgi:hypothetical protein